MASHASTWAVYPLPVTVAGRQVGEHCLDVCLHGGSNGGEWWIEDVETVDFETGERFSIREEAPQLFDLIKAWAEYEQRTNGVADGLTDAYKDSQPTLADDMMAAAWKVGR